METFIYKLNEKIFEGTADKLIAPSVDGKITILKNHTPLITRLDKGILKIKSSAQIQEIEIVGGTIQINENKVIGLIK